MTDEKLTRLISDATIAERYHFALAFEYALKGIKTMSTLTPYEAAAISTAEALWLRSENTLTAYRRRPQALHAV